jgi:hypothetical protein
LQALLPNRPLRLALLLTLILAVVLTLSIAQGAGAGSLFQSSPLQPDATPSPAEPPKVSQPNPAEGPEPPLLLPTETPAQPPNTEPGASQAPVPESAPTAAGFLPAPTLTNPDELRNGSALPAASAPLTGAAAPVEEPEATPEPAPPDAAQLIDSLMVALGYAWLCCGAGLLALAAVVFVWLMRRSARRRHRI